jgi:autotransporter-associated beta strand protein
VTAGIDLAKDSDTEAKDIASCTAETLVGPVTSDGAYCVVSAFDTVTVAKDVVNVATAEDAMIFADGQAASWKVANNQGSLGYGGSGGAGGTGGSSAFGLGGGQGGQGGQGGNGGGNAPDGYGGTGGMGGLGGFGAGGGQGGNGGSSGTSNLVGAPGAGGSGGFGGGTGSSGVGYLTPASMGGGGGAGLGGSIFVRDGGSLTITGNALFDGGNVIGGVADKNGVAGSADGSDIFMLTGSNVVLDPGAGNTQTFNGSIDDDSMGSPLSGTYSGTVMFLIGSGAGITIDSGHVNFNGGNLYSGVTKLNGGVLEAVDGGGLPSGTNLDFNGGVFMMDGAFLRYLGTDAYLVQWTGSGGFAADYNEDEGGPGDGGLTVTLNGNQQLVWNQDSFVPTGSALIFGSNDATNVVTWTNDIDLNGAVRTVLVAANADNSDTATMTGVLSNGGLNIGDSGHTGILILTAENAYAGTTTLNTGSTLILTGDGSIADSSSVTDNGTLDISQTNSGASFVTLAGNGTVTLGAQTLTLTNAGTSFDGTITGTGGLDVAAGTQTFTGTNPYTGTTTIENGAELALSGTGSIATSVGVVDNGAFDISATTAGASITTLSGSGTVNLGGEMLTFTNAGDTFSGVIGGAGGIKITGGTETLTGTNTYTGVTWIGAGDPPDLKLSGTGSIALSSGVVDNSIFDISATSAGASITTLSGTGSVVLGAQMLTLSNASDLFSGVISGSGAVIAAAGSETLSGVNTYTGTTTVNGGASLILTGSGAIASSSGVVDNGAFDISATTSGAWITTLSGNGTVALGAKTLTFTNASGNFSGVVGGTGGLTVAGGTQTLSGVNAYSGLTTINLGTTLALAGGGSIANSVGVLDNGTFDISATASGASINRLAGGGMITLGAETLTLTNAGDLFSGTAGGSGGLTVAVGSEMLSGTNIYTGATTVSAGASLWLTGMGSIATSSGVADNGTLDISTTASGASIMSLSGSGVVTLGGKTLTFTNASGNFSGAVGGTGGLTASGGAQTLSGVNTYTGATTINHGAALALSGGGSIATSSGVTDNGTFDISATTAGASVKTLSGSGAVALGAKTLTLTNASGTFSGIVGGTGAMAVTGGSETLTGANTYSGGTTISNATLSVNGNTAFGAASSPIAMNNGTLITTATLTSARNVAFTGANTINTNGQAVTLNGILSGAGGFTASGGGLLTLTNTNTYAGGTSIVGHTTVSICSDASLGAASGTVTITDSTLLTTCNYASTRTFTLNGTGKIDSNGNNLSLTGPITLDNGGNSAVLFTGTVQTTGPWTLSAQDGLYVTGTLSGTGTVSQKTTVAGLLSPGNSPGTITFTAPVVMLASSTTAIDVDGTGTGTGAGNYDRIVVQGVGNTFAANGTMVVKLRGITGSANNTYTPPVGQRFNIVHTDAGVTGSYLSLTEPSSGLATGTRFDAVYSVTDIDLVATPVSYANLTPIGVTDTKNRVSLGHAIDSYRLAPGVRMTGDRNPVLTALYSLPAGSIGASMDQIAGAVHGDAMTSALALNRMFSAAASDHSNGSGFALSAINPLPFANLASNNMIAAPEPAQLTDASPVWAIGLGQFSATGTDANAPGYRDNAGGVIVGVDLAREAGLSYGVAGSYARSEATTTNAASATVQSERVMGYGVLTQGEWRLNGEVALAVDEYDSKRVIQIGALTRVASGNSSGVSASLDAAAHYGHASVVPFVEMRYDYVGRSAFTETGAGDLSLNVGDESLSAPRTVTGLDVDLNRLVNGSDGNTKLDLRLAWAHDFSQLAGRTDASLVGSPLTAFTALSSQVGNDAGLFDLRASTKVSDTLSLFGEYDGETRSRSTTQSLSVGMLAKW